MLTLIVARARNGAIGKDNQIPWHKPEDLKMFQRETTGGALIMGRRTWESLPLRPLPKRLNVVVSRDPSVAEHVCASVEEAVALCRAENWPRLYGIGGEAIYRALLPLADRILLTEMDLEIADADAYFPEFTETDWAEISRRPVGGEGPDATLRDLIRRR